MKNTFNNKTFFVLLIIIIVIIVGYLIAKNNNTNNDEVRSIWTGKMHYYHDNALLLPDGNVLLIGETAGNFNPKTRKLKVIAAMPAFIRSDDSHRPTKTMLKDGRVLFTGGGEKGRVLKSAEIFDPKTGKTQKVADMNFRRGHYSATLLKDGKVLITGNYNRKVELFDPSTNKFTLLQDEMIYPRSNHTSILMNNGKVLLVGGAIKLGKTNTYYSQAEIFDPKTNSFHKVGSLNIDRRKLEAVVLNSGNVLVCGGDPVKTIYYPPCEIYDYKAEKFRILNNFIQPRSDFKMTKLSDGRVLITGGRYKDDKYWELNVLDSIEIFDPKTEKSTTVGKMRKKRMYHSTVLLNDNTVLLVGGYSNIVKNDLDLVLHWMFGWAGYGRDSRCKDMELLHVNNKGEK